MVPHFRVIKHHLPYMITVLTDIWRRWTHIAFTFPSKTGLYSICLYYPRGL